MKDRAKAARLLVGPAQQNEADDDLERRGVGFELADGLDAVHYEVQLNRPEQQEASKLTKVDAQPCDGRTSQWLTEQHAGQRVDQCATHPGLDAIPATGDERSKQRRQLGAARSE
ncbi:hypothetical protein D9M72_628250 [compost metagenome]